MTRLAALDISTEMYFQKLNLSNNRLSTLPEELKDLKELLRLDLSHNDFMILPKVAFKIPHLVFLSLKQNFIVGTYFEAPFLINELQKCYDLDLENCLRYPTTLILQKRINGQFS
ncbi:UNVERIFIED_CONTAM: hypothetical protein NCL1_57754 [Trichonephila clavipes]